MTGEIRRIKKMRNVAKIERREETRELGIAECDRAELCREPENFDDGSAIVSENCNCSVYTMASVAATILFCIGIVIYALIGA